MDDKMAMIYEINELDLFFFKVMANRYKKLDITPVQSRIIMVIASKKDGMYQKEIEDFIPCNKSTLSAILNTMEKNELIKRVDSEIDSRRNVIILTDKALEIVRYLKEDKKVLDHILLDNITDEEYRLFSDILHKLRNNMERI